MLSIVIYYRASLSLGLSTESIGLVDTAEESTSEVFLHLMSSCGGKKRYFQVTDTLFH